MFSVLEELLKSSEYVQNTLDFDSYESLIYTPVAERNGLHYLKAELDKFDYASGRKGEGDPEKRKKILELTLFIRRFEITRNWEDHNIDREWFSACIARYVGCGDGSTRVAELRLYPGTDTCTTAVPHADGYDGRDFVP
mgnify:CR=1 FL=1